MKADDRLALRRLLASFDEAGLVALANKGLVRRALKDLQTAELHHEETETALLVHGPGWDVTMPADGPVRATDSTRATGVTRQILMATIYLRDHWMPEVSSAAIALPTPEESKQESPASETEALEQTVLEISIEDLQKWAGKGVVRQTCLLVKSGLNIEVVSGAVLTIRLVAQEIEVRVLPVPRGKSAARLLDQALSTAPRSQHRHWVIVAVLAFQQSRGRAVSLPDESAPAEAAGTPVTRRQVQTSTQVLLENLVGTGLAHPSERMVERLFTLSLSATATHLPRLARLLRSLADDVSQVLGRTAAADTSRLYDRMCLTHALARALSTATMPPTAMVGFHRTQYDPVGDLQLAGIAAYPWQAASGYEGLSVLFWDGAGRRFLSWTTSRPIGTPGFHLAQSYRHEMVWSGHAPASLSRSCFTLKQARANALGRLSGSQATSADVLAPVDPAQLDFADRLVTDWSALREHARRIYPIGLREINPLEHVVVLQPTAWGERSFDELQQQLSWQLQDAAGNVLSLCLPWTSVNERPIEFLEALKPDRDNLFRVVARLMIGPHGLLIEPLSLLSRGTPQGHRVLNPGFDHDLITSRHSTLLESLRKKYGRDRVVTTMTDDSDPDSDAEGLSELDRLPPGLRGQLREAEGVLLWAAESGIRVLNPALRERFHSLASALEQLGVTELGQSLQAFNQAEGGAAYLLRSGYLCRLYRQAFRIRLHAGAPRL
jgi:hypothetical protein